MTGNFSFVLKKKRVLSGRDKKGKAILQKFGKKKEWDTARSPVGRKKGKGRRESLLLILNSFVS